MSTEIEYERTFLLKSLPDGLIDAESILIRDILVPETARHPHLRLRHKGDSYVITSKYPVSGGDSSKQFEHTIELGKEEFEALASCSSKGFVKRRYFIDLVGRPAEVDLYFEKLKGLAVVDFEFASEKEKDNFKVPDFVLADVTQDENLAGGMLAGKSLDDIMPKIEKYGYKKLEYSDEI
jgi:CYTH domain-containing protein